jgi:hypothetical protein
MPTPFSLPRGEGGGRRFEVRTSVPRPGGRQTESNPILSKSNLLSSVMCCAVPVLSRYRLFSWPSVGIISVCTALWALIEAAGSSVHLMILKWYCASVSKHTCRVGTDALPSVSGNQTGR